MKAYRFGLDENCTQDTVYRASISAIVRFWAELQHRYVYIQYIYYSINLIDNT